MYTCRVFFEEKDQSELNRLLETRLIRSIASEDSFVQIQTRKIWKMYLFNHHFRKFKRKFSYYRVVNTNRKIVHVPKFISNHYNVVIENKEWFFQKTSVFFENIHDIWKIRLALLL